MGALTFEQALAALALDPDVTALSRGPDHLVARFGHDKVGAIVRGSDRTADVEREVAGILEGVRTPAVELAVIGGPVSLRGTLERARAAVEGRTVHLYHQADDGDRWSSPGGGFAKRPLGDRFERGLDGGGLADGARAEAKIALDLAQTESDREVVGRFHAALGARVPRLTAVILAVIAAMFAVELWLGGPGVPPVIVRLGALSRPHVMEGELWRLLSIAFLHGSVLHILLNGWVLWALGSWTERLLGASRFAVLFTSAVLGGSLATTFFGGALSVGASGGLWGVLGAQAVQAFGPKGDLPEAMRRGARTAAAANLVLNLIVSFRPNIDMAGHFGGGIAGALVYLLVLRRGLPRWDQPGETAPAPRANALGMRIAGGIALVALFGSPIVAVLAGKPWLLTAPPELASRQIDGITLDVPVLPARDHLDPEVPRSPDDTTFGSVIEGPAWIRVAVRSIDPHPQSLDRLRQQIGPRAVPIEGAPGFVALDPSTDRLFDDLAGVMVGDDRVVIVEVVGWAGVSDAWRGVAERIARSAAR